MKFPEFEIENGFQDYKFFTFRYSKTKNLFKIVVIRQKELSDNSKFLSRNTPPCVSFFYIGKILQAIGIYFQ